METKKLREGFHTLFNKINNIFTAVGSNKAIFEEDLNKLSPQELKTRIADLSEALKVIEKNILILNDGAQEIYNELKREKGITPSDSSPDKLQK
ncbi:hypothetical protein ACFL2J_03215 [Candidatus Omnitrophota bacterium]